MKRSLIILFLFFIFVLVPLVAAQSIDDRGNPNNPNDNERANTCYDGGSMADKCISDWEWVCGYYLIRFEYGILSRENFPSDCAVLLPSLPQPENPSPSNQEQDEPDGAAPGCYLLDSSLFFGDIYFEWEGGTGPSVIGERFDDSSCTIPFSFGSSSGTVVVAETVSAANALCGTEGAILAVSPFFRCGANE